MKKDILFIVLISLVLLMFVIGATGCETQEKKEVKGEGLIMEFVENAPPAQISPGVLFPIYVNIQNNGGYEIKKGQANFYLSGVGQNLRGHNTVLSNNGDLTKKGEQIEGGKETLIFGDQVSSNIQLSNIFDFSMKLDSCYEYATMVETTICVGKGDICSVGEEKIKTGDNTIAPVQITSLTEKIEGNRQVITFLIENVGSGNVYYPNVDCNKIFSSDTNERLQQELMKNKVEIAISSPDGFICKLESKTMPHTTKDLMEGRANVGYSVFCEKDISVEEQHSSPVQISLFYKYVDSISQSLSLLPY